MRMVIRLLTAVALIGGFAVTAAQTPGQLTPAFPVLPLAVAQGGTGASTLTGLPLIAPVGLVKGDVGLGNVDNTSDATKNAAMATLANKTLTSPTINTPTLSLSGTTAQVLRGDGSIGSVPGAVLTGTTGSIGGGALGAGACAAGTVNVTGATTSMGASASPLAGVDPTNGGVLGVTISARVSSAGVVTVAVCAPIIGTPTAATYKVTVQP